MLEVPTDTALTEEQARLYFCDMIMGIEYRKFGPLNPITFPLLRSGFEGPTSKIDGSE